MNDTYSGEELRNLPFHDMNLPLEERVEDLLKRLTLEEKFKLCAGKQLWFTKPIKRLGIPSFKMTDGPHGIAPHSSNNKECTYFPTAICRASTWNPSLLEHFGVALAEEVREIGYHMILGPGINIQRTPMCGRTFEYQTEDPYLNSKLAVATVKGIQSQRIAACVKHYACNNQETNRFTYSAEVSERALQEIYLPAFRATVIEADAWSFMSCYNKVNGVYGSESEDLIKKRLMGEWGFRGFVVSDWGASSNCTSTESCIKAGLSLEMPRPILYKDKKLKKAFNEGKFSIEALDDNIRRLLRVMFLTGMFDDPATLPSGKRNTPEHQELARRIAEEGLVLLKNQGGLLPLDLNAINKIAILGPNADKKMAEGGGSSQVKPPHEITPLEALKQKCGSKIVVNSDPSDADVALIFAGLNHEREMDAEGIDKKSFHLPQDQVELIKETAKKNPKTIVVLIIGSPVSMIEWIDDVPVVLIPWYAGMEAGYAITNILFGEVNPSGKLPITFPKNLSDSPAHQSHETYPGNEKVLYKEGVFVGYRHFDTRGIEPLFPFGYGLSYTNFTCENISLSSNSLKKGETLTIAVDVINTGDREGAEVVQLYLQDAESSVERPLKELKGFSKVFLNPKEKKTVQFTLTEQDLSFFDEKSMIWKSEPGTFKVLIGNSSKNILQQAEFEYIE